MKKDRILDMVIVGRGKCLNGDNAITYFYKDQPDLRRITTQEYEDQVIEFKREFIKKYL